MNVAWLEIVRVQDKVVDGNKQLLSDLSGCVNMLHTKIETVQQKQLLMMERELDKDRKRLIRELLHGEEVNESVLKERIRVLVQDGGPFYSPRRVAASFQYSSLRQLLLPYYKQYFLWSSLKDDSFFTKAKEKRSKVSLIFN